MKVKAINKLESYTVEDYSDEFQTLITKAEYTNLQTVVVNVLSILQNYFH